MARLPLTTLATPIVTMAGASKPYLPVIAPAITLMASGACATPSEKGHRGHDHEGRRGHGHAWHHALHAGLGRHAHNHHVAVIAAAHVSRHGLCQARTGPQRRGYSTKP